MKQKGTKAKGGDRNRFRRTENEIQSPRERTRQAVRARVRAASLNEEARTFEMVMATEAPVEMFWGREVLLMDGAELPAQVPLLNAHSRFAVEHVLGSVREMRVEGTELIGQAAVAGTPEGDRLLTLVREGHLTDVSVGYRIKRTRSVPSGETHKVGDREFEGPVELVEAWSLMELSAVPVGADSNAKLRGQDMDEDIRRRAEDEELEEVEQADSGEETEEEMAAEGADDSEEETQEGAKAADVKAERARILEITELGQRHKLPGKLVKQFIERGTPLAVVRQRALEHLENTRQPVNATMVRDERETFRAAVPDAILLRAGLVAPDKAHGAAKHYARFRLLDIVREFVERNGGGRTRGMSDREVMRKARELNARAFSSQGTADFDNILENTLNKALGIGFDRALVTWNQWCRTMTANDLRQHNIARLSDFDRLARVGENGEVPSSTLSDEKETLQPYQWARRIQLTDAVFINDDLDAFTMLPTKFGMAAASTVNEAVYHRLLDTSTTLNDGNVLFDASNHSNYTASGSGAPTEARLNTGRKFMRKQLSPKSRPLNITPSFILVPPELEETTEQLLGSEYTVVANGAMARNTWYGRLTPVVEPLLSLGATIQLEGDVASTSSGSTAAWYLTASPQQWDTFVVAFLGGQQTPVVDQARPIEVLGTDYRVSMAFGVGVADYRGVYKDIGTA